MRILLALLCLVMVDVARAEDLKRPFSDAEKKQLAAGQLVTRRVQEEKNGLRLIGGSSWQVIKAPPDTVFRALLDTPRYDRMLPTVSRAQLISQAPTLRRVKLEHKKGPLGISYRMALIIDPARRDISFKLNDALQSGIRAAWGYLTVAAYGDKTLLSYGVMADPGDGLIVGLVRSVIQDWLLRVPEQTRKHIESSAGRVLYGSKK
ncbi:MAG: SRPBCC family protein [Polyangiales bacterium]